MNNKPNHPDELWPGKKEYSGRADLKVNGWGYLSMILSLAGDMALHCCKGANDWPMALRALIVLAPLPPALLWLRSYARWVRGMDEFHRRLEVEACLFATTAVLFLFMALHPLAKAGIFQELGFKSWWLLDWNSWWLKSWLLVCFYMLGSKIFNRRYR